jgi:fructosamine-3-kinase
MSRRDIYYWKCDRPAAFHGTHVRGEADAALEGQLRETLRIKLGCRRLTLTAAPTQGNHLTWNADADGRPIFIRLESGPEHDDYLVMESAVMQQVRALGLPVPEVLAVDASRTHVAGAWQAVERIPHPDLNHWFKQGMLADARVAFDIGAAVARWQTIRPEGFGPFQAEEPAGLRSFHARYEDYFRLRLPEHLRFLVESGFLTPDQRADMEDAIDEHQALLQVERGCLVHKDLALWNILGSRDQIAAFIDFDDAISGDPMDDLSLLACFHDAAFLQHALEGYEGILSLPDEYRRRFWLHLLRNMIVKSVIRVGAGYFERDSGFFLIGSGSSGADLRRFTLERLCKALHGLRHDDAIAAL